LPSKISSKVPIPPSTEGSTVDTFIAVIFVAACFARLGIVTDAPLETQKRRTESKAVDVRRANDDLMLT
jgi:hypothetical protein